MFSRNRFSNDDISNDDIENEIRRLFRETTPVAPKVDTGQLMKSNRNHRDASVSLFERDVKSSVSLRADKFLRADRWNKGFAFLSSQGMSRVLAPLIGLVTVTALLILIFRGSSEIPEFGNVQAQVEQLKTVQFTNFQTKPDEPTSQPRKLRISILGRFLQRTEIIGQTGTYDLIDARTGRLFHIDTNNKIFRELTKHVTIDKQTGVRTETELKVPVHIDFYENITRFPESLFEYVKAGSVGNRPAEQFRCVYVDRLSTRTVLIWVDSRTRLPLHIEIRLRSKDPAFNEVDYIYTDFVYDEPLDESMFDTRPPEGYKVMDGEFIERK